MHYLAGWVAPDRPDGLVIECARGIAFRLRVVDEAGAPVEAAAQYYPVMPNPHLDGLMPGGLWRCRFCSRTT